MPLHDWTRVPVGLYHAFHHLWTSALSDSLNNGILPDDLYTLPEQVETGTRPKTTFFAESEAEFYRRKKSAVVVRHVSGDRIVAVVEIVSPGNKAGAYPIESFVRKACDFLERGVHLLIMDPFPPGPRDPDGIRALIWREFQPEPFRLPEGKPLTLVAYETALTTRAYIEPIAVGDPLPDMPLFLHPDVHVLVPLEATYQTAFNAYPRRWRNVLQPPTG